MEDYMIQKYGHLMPKKESHWTRNRNSKAAIDRAHPNPFGSPYWEATQPVPPEYVPSFSDFMLNAGEYMRQEYWKRYKVERDTFLNDKASVQPSGVAPQPPAAAITTAPQAPSAIVPPAASPALNTPIPRTVDIYDDQLYDFHQKAGTQAKYRNGYRYFPSGD